MTWEKTEAPAAAVSAKGKEEREGLGGAVRIPEKAKGAHRHRRARRSTLPRQDGDPAKAVLTTIWFTTSVRSLLR
jgi:hypothetical protein